MALPNFHEIRFPEKIAFGATGGPGWNTTVVATLGGFEQRNRNWEQARRRYVVGHEIKTIEEYDELLDFFQARRGKAFGFRFRDFTDMASDMPGLIASGIAFEDELPAAGTMSPVDAQNVSDESPFGDGLETQFQIVKTYRDVASPATLSFDSGDVTPSTDRIALASHGLQTGDGPFTFTPIRAAWGLPGGLLDDGTPYWIIRVDADAIQFAASPGDAFNGVPVDLTSSGAGGPFEAIEGFRQTRPITKPVAGAVRAFFDGVEQATSTFVVDWSRGLVAFNVAPAADVRITFDYFFDVPVRFDSDSMDPTLDEFNVVNWEGIQIVELRE